MRLVNKIHPVLDTLKRFFSPPPPSVDNRPEMIRDFQTLLTEIGEFSYAGINVYESEVKYQYGIFAHDDIRQLYQETYRALQFIRKKKYLPHGFSIFTQREIDKEISVMDYLTMDNQQHLYFNPTKTIKASVDSWSEAIEWILKDKECNLIVGYLEGYLKEWSKVYHILLAL